MVVEQGFYLGAALVAAIAAWTDFRKGIIPQWLVVSALIAGPVGHGITGALRAGALGAFQGAVFSILGVLACGFVPYVLFQQGGMFGGDVKLLAAVGALCRPMVGIEAEFYAFIAAAIYAMGKLTYNGKLFRTLTNTVFLVLNPFLPKAKKRTLTPEMMTEQRFGPAVLVGVIVATWLHWRMP